MGITSISAVGTYYVTSEVIAPSDPTSASVYFAFLGPYATSQQAEAETPTSSTTFYTGSWGTTLDYPTRYTAQCLVGTAGTVTLGVGTYTMWVKVDSSPETPIIWSGPLVVA